MSFSDHALRKSDPRQRAWVEVDPNAIEANALALKNLVSNECLLMAVVKADGYGHGAGTVAKAALRGGASSLGVATLQEGIDLRQLGIDCPILILGNLINSVDFDACIHWDLMPTLSSNREASICQNLAEKYGTNLKVQVKIDTGMTRLGCDLKDAVGLSRLIDNCSNLILVGIYSHLALADASSDLFNQEQQGRFESILRHIKPAKGICLKHLANSAGTLRDRSLHYDMVRVGLALYGYSPIRNLHETLNLKPALSVKARVTFIRDVPAGIGVSYGHSFTTNRISRLAVVAIGYADGVSRVLSGRISAIHQNQFLPQVGSITMDQMVLDVTDHAEVVIGSIVTLLGPDGDICISPKEWSHISGSIPWEILCSFKNRLPRIVI